MTDDGRIQTPADLLGYPRRRFTIVEVARLLGLSKERVRQIEKQALFKMSLSPLLRDFNLSLVKE